MKKYLNPLYVALVFSALLIGVFTCAYIYTQVEESRKLEIADLEQAKEDIARENTSFRAVLNSKTITQQVLSNGSLSYSDAVNEMQSYIDYYAIGKDKDLIKENILKIKNRFRATHDIVDKHLERASSVDKRTKHCVNVMESGRREMFSELDALGMSNLLQVPDELYFSIVMTKSCYMCDKNADRAHQILKYCEHAKKRLRGVKKDYPHLF